MSESNTVLKPLTDEEQAYEYLIVIDFEATCDSGDSPLISLSKNNQEMIEFPFVVLKILNEEEKTNTREYQRVIHSEQNYVLPEYSAELTPFCTQLTGITDSTLKSLGKPLRKVLSLFDKYIEENLKDKRFSIICDGEWDLKQLMIRESINKNIPLKDYFYRFFDLKKEYRKCFPDAHVRGLSSMVQHSGIEFVGRHHSGIDDCHTIAQIVNVMLGHGHQFIEPVYIDRYYDPFRDSSFSNFRQTSPQNNAPYSHHLPVYAYSDPSYNPYSGHSYTAQQYQYYKSYIGAYPTVSHTTRQKKHKRKRRPQSNPAPSGMTKLPIVLNKSDRTL